MNPRCSPRIQFFPLLTPDGDPLPTTAVPGRTEPLAWSPARDGDALDVGDSQEPSGSSHGGG